MQKPIKSMYVHVPFCQSICGYCDFTRVKNHPVLIEKWMTALKSELSQKSVNRNLETIYIGGGTPSSLSEGMLTELFHLLEPYTGGVKEYTIEINPETMNLSKLEIMKKYGINRISIGVQAIQPHLLEMMNRRHSWQLVQEWVKHFKDAGITNISLDAMYSLPDQTMEDWHETLQSFIALKVPHISLYSLTIEENSQFHRDHREPLDESMEAEMYFAACKMLQEAGYEHYEISNFSLPGYASKHNQTYWKYDDFYGIGLGASGKENHCRYDNTSNFETYFSNPIASNKINLTVEDEMFEMVMMNLRLKSGMQLNDFEEKFSCKFVDVYQEALRKALDQNWLCLSKTHVFCTEKGYPILNTILTLFLE